MTNAATTTPHWTYLARPAGGDGHRFFRRSDGRVAIADNSGATPSQTEDGPLFLDPSRKAEVDFVSDSAVVYMPVLQPVGGIERTCGVALTLRDLNWLLGEDLWDVEGVTIAGTLHPFAMLLDRIGGLR